MSTTVLLLLFAVLVLVVVVVMILFGIYHSKNLKPISSTPSATLNTTTSSILNTTKSSTLSATTAATTASSTTSNTTLSKTTLKTTSNIDTIKNKIDKTLDLIPKSGNDIFPWYSENGGWKFDDSSKWISGFFPAQILLTNLYNSNNSWSKDKLNQVVQTFFPKLESQKTNGTSHDIGFKIFLPYVLAYKITNDNKYKNVIETAAKTLSSRYNDKVGMIKSWDNSRYGNEFVVITDNLMNLELLLWAGKNLNNLEYTKQAISHLDKTMNDFPIDKDSGCMWHVVIYDVNTGQPKKKSGLPQGYSDTQSIWSRGMAWTIYGYTMAYRYTNLERYKIFAQKALDCYLQKMKELNVKDNIPPFDFKAPSDKLNIKDSSAAAIIAAALYEWDDGDKIQLADSIIKDLEKGYISSDNFPYILLHGYTDLEKNQIDNALIYGDYYYTEAKLKSMNVDIDKMR